MNLLLRCSGVKFPEFIKKKELKKLTQLTAAAFGSTVPASTGGSYEECLAGYARFTKTAAEESITNGVNMEDIRDRLFQLAKEYGTLWRKRFGVTNTSETMRAAKILYHSIGIELHGSDQGEIEIVKCFFSQYYSTDTCRVISALDAGMLAGLSGGSTLRFSRRMTEGFVSCRANLRKEDISI